MIFYQCRFLFGLELVHKLLEQTKFDLLGPWSYLVFGNVGIILGPSAQDVFLRLLVNNEHFHDQLFEIRDNILMFVVIIAESHSHLPCFSNVSLSAFVPCSFHYGPLTHFPGIKIPDELIKFAWLDNLTIQSKVKGISEHLQFCNVCGYLLRQFVLLRYVLKIDRFWNKQLNMFLIQGQKFEVDKFLLPRDVFIKGSIEFYWKWFKQFGIDDA